ncbi:hypothetical protein F2Q68_00022290 [Brassica cretica]|uniref:Uncharacterized protein n=1 Tax=Brassica cretica TaxID=69181 RepID=A0A8S9FUN9_BRACR|nr:hypothetical protein F2Q68_00022290 [Brassica cretica]
MKEMAHIPVVYGEWMVKGSLWEFVVNNRKVGRMFLVPDGCTHGELHEMTLADYGLDKKIEKVELTYSLPEVILQQMAPDSPHMHVTNDRQEMAQIPVVYGEWVVKGSLWEFVVNNRKGGRMFLVLDGCTHGGLHEMALEDYGLDKKIEKVELTYSLPDVILQQMTPDTPTMHVTNDRQVRNLIELAKTHFVCLCVSSQSQVEAGVDDDADVSDGDDSNFADEDTGQDTDSE